LNTQLEGNTDWEDFWLESHLTTAFQSGGRLTLL